MHTAAGMPGSEETYEDARVFIETLGGVTYEWLVAPQPSTPYGDHEDWVDITAADSRGLAPNADELIRLLQNHGGAVGDPVILGLDALLEDPLERSGDGALLAARLACADGT
jgi:hypothetical protein